MSKFSTLLFLTFFSSLTALALAPLAKAGGGTYSLNISNGQTIAGGQFEVIVTVTDNTKPEPYPLVVGEEFEVAAHPESSGERCETYQKKTDGSGQFKARCYSDQNGKFAFHLHPITRADLPDSGSIEVFFQLNAPTTAPAGSPSPTPSPSVASSPAASPKVSPTPLAVVVKASPSPKASSSPSPKASPSPTPSPTPSPVVSPAAELASPSPTPEASENFRPNDLQIGIGVGVIMAVVSSIMVAGWHFFGKIRKR